MQTRDADVMSDGFLQVGRYRTRLLSAGRGEPLILVHGFGIGNAADLAWEKVIPGLAERFHVYAPDMLGFGQTDKPVPCAIQDEVDHVVRMLDALCLARVFLMGNSVGGYICFKTALDHPDRVRAVFGIGSGTLAKAMGLIQPDVPARQVMRDFDGSYEAMQRFMTCVQHRPSSIIEEVVNRRLANANLPGAEAYRQASSAYDTKVIDDPNEWQRFSVKDRLPAATFPMKMVWGIEDQFTPVTLGYDLERLLPNITFEYLEACGHTCQNDDPEKIVRLATSFFRQYQPVHSG